MTDVFRMIFRVGLRLLASSVGLGLLASFGVTRVIASQLWGVSPRDPVTLGLVVAVVAIAGFAACYFPARRATRGGTKLRRSMQWHLKRIGLAGLLGAGLVGCLSATTVVVDSKSEVFFTSALAPFDPQGVTTSTTFTAVAGQTLTFSSVTGTVSCGTGCMPTSSPKGGSTPSGFTGTNIAISGGNSGLSGITFIGTQMFLIGVFLDPTFNGTGAVANMPAYTTSSANAASFSPILGQSFFIGDGQGTSATQIFNIPTTATRLFLGFADGVPGLGSATTAVQPGAYGDNIGSLTAIFTINAASPVPEPGTSALFALGLAGLAVGCRKRSV